MNSYFAKIGRMAVIGAATASLSLVTTIPVFGQSEGFTDSSIEAPATSAGEITIEDGSDEPTNQVDKNGYSTNQVDENAYSAYKLAPSCVQTFLRDEGYWDSLTVTNRCRTTQRVKVVLAYARDSACTSILPNYYVVFRWGYPGRFDRLESC
jgi:hypothetical protein